MKPYRLALISFLFFAILSSLPLAYAPEDIDIMEVPQQVGEAFGIPEPNTATVGGLFMSCIVFLALVLPTLLLRNKAPALIMAFMVLCFVVSVAWLPLWVLLISLLIVAGFMGKRVASWFK